MKRHGVYLYQSLGAEVKKILEQHRKTIPVDIAAIIKAFNIKVIYDILPRDVTGAIKKSEDSEIAIYCEITDPQARQRFTLAHELSHYLLGHLDRANYITDNVLLRSSIISNTDERNANYLAAELLMPMSKIDELTKKDLYTIDMMASEFNVSSQALSIRLGII